MGRSLSCVEDSARVLTFDRNDILMADPAFDRLSRLAAKTFQTSIALISVADESRLWFKGRTGLELTDVPREASFCNSILQTPQLLVIPDARLDRQMSDNCYVLGPPYVRFYAGAPLINKEGFCLGTLCVFDTEPRERPSDEKLEFLQELADAAVDLFEIHQLKKSVAALHEDVLRREQELQDQRESNLQLREQIELALDAGQMGTWQWNGASPYVERSAVTNRMLGLEDDSTLPSWAPMIHPDDAAETIRKLRACRDGICDFQAEYRVIQPGGKTRWISSRGRMRLNSSSKRVMTGVCWDMTDRKVAAQQLRESQEVERGWSAASPSGVFRTDQAGGVISANERCQAIFRSTDHQIRSGWNSFADSRLVHPEDRAILESKWQSAVEQGLDLDLEYRTSSHDGGIQWIHLRLVPLRNEQGTLTGFLGSVDDVTSKKESQQRLEGLQQLLQSAVDQMPQRVFWKDCNNIYQGCNQAFARDLGLARPSDVVGTSDYDSAYPDFAEQYRASDRKVMESGIPELNFEEEAYHRQGTKCVIRTSKTPLFDHQGKVVGVLGTYEDITEQRRKEQELIAAKDAAESAASVKGQFLANMSHEIRTPLNGVLGMISLLLESQLGGEQRKWAETAQMSGEALLRLLNNVLDLSKAEAGKIVVERLPFNLRRTVHQCVELLQSEADVKGLRLGVNFPQTVPNFVVGDALRLRQILVNFLANAVKFTSTGSITVWVKSDMSSAGELRLRIAVEDTGIGIPTNAEQHLFQPFSQADGSTTRRFGGTGLGLSIAKQLAELMEGTVGFTANPAGGSTFWLELPVGQATGVAPEPKSPVEAASTFDGKTILVVEDNPVNQLVTSRFLKKFGCTVEVASNGREALNLWETRSYDLVLMDGQMPELDGYQATQQMRELERLSGRNRTPIVALTAHALPGDKERCLAAGMDDYLSKPVQQELLRTTLELWLRSAAEPVS